MKNFDYKKGDYERNYERIRICLDNNLGVSKIAQMTNLKEDEVIEFTRRIQEAREDEYNDFN